MAVVICGAAAGVPADRARLHPEAQPDAAGDAVAWAGTADLLRAVPDAADPDAGEGRPFRACRSPASAARCCSRRSRCRCCASRCGPLFTRMAIDGPAFTSIFQGATRWQTYVALAVSGNLFGHTRAGAGLGRDGRHHPAGQRAQRLACSRNTPRRKSNRSGAIVHDRRAAIPLIWACAIGLAVNVTQLPLPKLWHDVADALGRSSLGIGLLVTGAGLHLERLVPPEPRRLGRRFPQAGPDAGDRRSRWRCWFGISGSNLVIVAVCSAVPALVERLRAGPADGWRCAAARADHHAADDPRGDHHAGRDRAGSDVLTPPASQKVWMVAAGLLMPRITMVSQVELLR